MSVEINPEDFREWDVDIAECAGGELFAVLADLVQHNHTAGEGWYPFAEDLPAVIAELRGHVTRLEEAIRKTKADIASIERPARLAAYRRIKRKEQR